MMKVQSAVIAIQITIHLVGLLGHTGFCANVLSPASVDVSENSALNFTCTCTCLPTAVEVLKYVKWDRGDQTAIVVYQNKNCTSSAFLSDRSLYSYGCSEEMYYVTLKNVTRQNEGEIWSCSTGVVWAKSNSVTIRVKVPVRNVTLLSLGDTLEMKENSSIFLRCTTSPCRPEPRFEWYAVSKQTKDHLLLSEAIPSTNDSAIKEFHNNFSFVANRSLNGWSLYCSAYNGQDVPAVNSREVFLNVLYPPEKPTEILGFKNGSLYSVVLGSSVNLTCTVTGGNPLSRIDWNTGSVSSEFSNGSTVSRIVNWLARDRNPTELRCRSVHPVANYTAYITTNVLYPPNAPQLTLLHSQGHFKLIQNVVSVIENSSLTLSSKADSNPPLQSFKWSRFSEENISTLLISNIKRGEAGSLTCHVFNEMIPTLGKPVTGANVSEVFVDVQYPPHVKVLANKTLIEGEILSYECVVETGNPNKTVFKWENTTDHKVINTNRVLQLASVSRCATGTYRCIAENEMNATDGTFRRDNSTRQFFLDVQYGAYVSQLIVDSQLGNNVTLNENDSVKIVCTIEGNPAPVGSIIWSTPAYGFYERGKETVVNRPPNRTFEAQFVASCYDAGEYSCIGNNTLYTGEQRSSTEAITININCKPRMSRVHEVKPEVYAPIHKPVTLTFTALAYPVPPASGYVWLRQHEDDSWTNITSSSSFYNVSTQGLQSNLTVTNVTKSDYGLYSLIISNYIGVFTFTFSIIPVGKPSPPVKYGILDETDSSITVWWEPEFNGGDPQSFIIGYRISSSDAWLNLSSIPEESETGNSMMLKIGGLKSNSQYHFLIYAENKFGSVRIENDIIVQTKEVSKTAAGNVGAAVGGGVGAAVILILIVLVIVIVCKRKRKPNAMFKADEVIKDNTYHNLARNAESQYQQLSAIKEDEHGYMKNIDAESQYQQLSAVKEDEHGYMENIGQQKVYENLRITHSIQEQSIRQREKPY